jgi:hypothetical protein
LCYDWTNVDKLIIEFIVLSSAVNKQWTYHTYNAKLWPLFRPLSWNKD